MTAPERINSARRLVAEVKAKGLLAMDESNATCDKRFTAVGIPQTHEARCAYRNSSLPPRILGVAECVWNEGALRTA